MDGMMMVKGVFLPIHLMSTGEAPLGDRKVLCVTKTKKGRLGFVLGYYDWAMKRWVCGMNDNVVAWLDLPEPEEVLE